MFSLRSKHKRPSASQGLAASRKACLAVEQMESRLVPYSVSGNAWPHPEMITIGFVPDGTIVGSDSQGYLYSNLQSTFDNHANATFRANWRRDVLKAAQVWAQQTNVNLSVISDNGAEIGTGNYQQGDPLMADIRIGGYNFGTTTLAQAYMPPPVNNYSIAGDFQFNTGANWNLGAQYDLFSVATHEFGHALGLYHSGYYGVLMYGSYTGTKTALAADDINGIRNIYSTNLARGLDVFDAVLSNGSFLLATGLDSLLNLTNLTALVPSLNLSTPSDKDYYAVLAPLGTSSTLQVNVQSQGLSLLSPKVTVYAANQTVLGSASAAGDYDGATLSVTVNGVTPLQLFFVKVEGAETGAGSLQAFNTGKYALTLNFGTGASPTVPLPNTQTANGETPSGGGGQAVKVDAEYRVNTTTSGTQQTAAESRQAVAVDAHGNYVVAWSSYGQDGSGWGVYAQRYDAAGVAQGSAFRVNSYTGGDQKDAAVAMDPAGNFVIAWASDDQDGSGWGVYAQRYDAAGAAQGSAFRVHSYTGGDQKDAAVAMDPAGNFVIAWSSNGQDGSGWGVYAQCYDAAGVAQGSAFRVNSYTGGDQKDAAVAMDPAGNFVIAWASDSQDGSGWGVYAQGYDAAGVAQGSAFRVHSYTGGDQKDAAVAMDPAGNFVITWSSNGQDGDGWGVYAQRYNAAGVAQGSAFRVNTTTAADLRYATVGMDGSGNFLITWSSDEQDHSGWGVYAQQYDSAGVALGPEFRVNTTTSGDQEYSSLALNDTGDAVAVWSGNGPGDTAGIFAQRYHLNDSSGLNNLTAEADPYGEFDHDHGDQGHHADPAGEEHGTAREDHSGLRPAAEVLARWLDSAAGFSGVTHTGDSRPSDEDTTVPQGQQVFEPRPPVRAEGTRAWARRASWGRAHDACFAHWGAPRQTADALPAW